MLPISVLDLSPIADGSDAGQSLRNTLDLARHAERLGYHRYWLAEHHNMPGIASAAPAVVIGQVAAATSTIRVGAGGIMLPNHAPLVIAEQFGTLEALFPGRIDLGLGRAPGSDQVTAQALRRTLAGSADSFPNDVQELQAYLMPAVPQQVVQAVPGAGSEVPLWILGSSLFGAQLAAHLGLPYAFASHFAPGEMERAITIYRDRFEPSAQLDEPYVMLGLNVFAADSEDEAELLFSSLQQAFVNLRSGRPGKLPRPVENYSQQIPPAMQGMIQQALACSAVGTPEMIRAGVERFIEHYQPDELIITAQIHDHTARLRSFELTAEALGLALEQAA